MADRMPSAVTRVMHEHGGTVHHVHDHTHRIVGGVSERGLPSGNQPNSTSSEGRTAFEHSKTAGLDTWKD